MKEYIDKSWINMDTQCANNPKLFKKFLVYPFPSVNFNDIHALHFSPLGTVRTSIFSLLISIILYIFISVAMLNTGLHCSLEAKQNSLFVLVTIAFIEHFFWIIDKIKIYVYN